MKRGYLRAEDGSLAIATAIGGAILCGAAGLAIIVAQGNLGKSQLQASLDAAVLGAVSLPFGSSDAKRIGTAQAIFDANIAEYVKPAESVFQSISSPTFTVKAGIVSGEASSSVKNGFAAMVGISKMDIKQHAAARKALSDPLCVLALNPQQSATIEIYGNAEMRANDCAVLANSNDGTGLKQYGNGSKASASMFGVQGGFSGNNWSPKPNTGVEPVKDPYADLPVPAAGPCTNVTGKLTQDEFTLDPGTYCGGLSIAAHAKVRLNPGIYIFKDGQLSIGSGAVVKGEEVLLAFVGSNSYLDMLSQAEMKVTSPKTGTYANFQFMSDRELSQSKFGQEWTTIHGGARLDYDGVMYLPEQQFWLSGTSQDIIVNANSPTLSAIADKIWVQGNSVLNITQENRRNIDVAGEQATYVIGAVLIR